jgi:hypothetical protein
MTSKLKKLQKKVKVKIPKIQRTISGRKFIKIGKKTVYLDDDVTPNQLLKFVLSRVLKKPQRRTKTGKETEPKSIQIVRPTSTVGPGDDKIVKLLEEQKRDLERKEYEKKLKQKVDDEIAAKIPKDAIEKFVKQKKKSKVPIYDDHGNKINEYEIDEDLANMYKQYTDTQVKEIEGHKKKLEDLHKQEAKEKEALYKERKKIEAELVKTKFESLASKKETINEKKEIKLNKLLNKKYPINKVRQIATAARFVNAGGSNKADMVKWLLERKIIKPEIEFKDELAEYNDQLEKFDKEEAQIRNTYKHIEHDFNLHKMSGDVQLLLEGNNNDSDDELPPLEEDELGIDMSQMKASPRNDDDDNISQAGDGRGGVRGLYTSQIEHMMKSYKPNYLGCIAANEVKTLLPSVKKQRQICFIQNTDDKTGIHWVAWFIDRDRKTVEYYDSLADPLPENLFNNIQPLLKKISARGDKWKWKYNVIRDQLLNSDTCGWFCMVFLRDRLNGIPFKIASHYEKGEKRIKQVMKNMKHQFGYVDGLTGEGWRDVLASAWNAAKNVGKKVVDGVKSVINLKPRDGWSPSIRKLLEKHGSKNITNITLYRQPIQSFVSKALDWVTLGKFSENVKAAGYSAAMHLYLSFTLEDGTSIRFDKNHVVEASLGKGSPGAETMPVGLKSIPLNDFLNKGIDHVGKEKYFIYDSKTQNCQWWIIWNLQANGLLTSTIKSWVLQDAESIYKNLGLLEKVNRGITDVAAKLDTALYGAGRNKRSSKTKAK